MEVVDQDIRSLWNNQRLCPHAKRLWLHRCESQGRFPWNGDNLDCKEKRMSQIIQNIRLQVTARHIIPRVRKLNIKFSIQFGSLNSKLPNRKARLEFRITLPICCFHLCSYSTRGVPILKCSAITWPAIRPPIMAIVIPAPFDGRTIPAASPTSM